MADNSIYIDELINEHSKKHKVYNKKLINKAFDYTFQMYTDLFRSNGEEYYLHHLRVAIILAKFGFESEIIAASLLPNTEEEYGKYRDSLDAAFEHHRKVTAYLGAIVALRNELNEDPLFGERYECIDNKNTDLALYILAAERLDIMSHIDAFSEYNAERYAEVTRNTYIPLLVEKRAYTLVDQLEDLCLSLEHPDRFEFINTRYKAILKKNKYTTEKTIKLFEDIFSSGTKYLSGEAHTVLPFISSFKYNERNITSIYRQINEAADNISEEADSLLNKRNIPLYDFTLVVSDEKSSINGNDRPSELSPTDIFFKVYEEVLMDRDICILEHGKTVYGGFRYFVLQDKMLNQYRMFVKTETQYLGYILGPSVGYGGARLDGPLAKDNQIKVFTKKGDARYIDSGATMLDFAFLIHSDVGFHFDYAYVDNSKIKRKAYDRLNAGDTITIVTNPDIQPKIQWFKYVKTNKAIEHLIRRFDSV